MKIWTYVAFDPDVPEGQRALARIRCAIPGAKGKLVEDFHPVLFQGADVESVREVAQQWWDAEIAKAEAKAGKPRGRPKKAAEPEAPPPIADEAVI